MKHINIITRDNQSGLTKDAKIIADILRKAGFRVSVFEVGKPTVGHKLHRISTYVERFASNTLRRKPPYDINVFLEDVFPVWFPYARINCMIPNQEWFRDYYVPHLPRFDWVLCKTKYAQDIFKQLGCRTEFISFTSLDRLDENYSKNYEQFFHLAGSNRQKGTKPIIDLWLRHPEWPRLTVIQNPQNARNVSAANIEYITAYVSTEVLSRYQNSCGVHLCLSEAEGFGHYIVEAMSCKAVTVTTNAPPMNEIITSERGLLADYHTTKEQRLGTNYYVDPDALEQKIEEILAMNEAKKQQLGGNARAWYEENDQFFQRRLVEVIEKL